MNTLDKQVDFNRWEVGDCQELLAPSLKSIMMMILLKLLIQYHLILKAVQAIQEVQATSNTLKPNQLAPTLA